MVLKRSKEDEVIEGNVYWMDGSFCLRKDFYNDPKNQTSILWQGVRYFQNKEEARQYVCLGLLLHSPILTTNSRIVSSFLSIPEDKEFIDNSRISAIRVMPGPNTRWDKSRLPHCVIISYRKGGVGYYLTNDCGHPITPVYLRIPPSTGLCTENNEARIYRAIVAHRFNNGKVEVCVRWDNNQTSWELLSSLTKIGTHWHAQYYAKLHGLLDKAGWKSVNRWGSWKIADEFINPNTNFDSIERSKLEEDRCTRAENCLENGKW